MFDLSCDAINFICEYRLTQSPENCGTCPFLHIIHNKEILNTESDQKHNPDSALRYNNGKLQWSLVDFESFEPMVKVLEYGEHKYSIFKNKNGDLIKGKDISIQDTLDLELVSSGRNNWKKGFDLLKVLESLTRHLFALLRGEEIDKESGLPHIGHLMCNAMFFSYHKKREKK